MLCWFESNTRYQETVECLVVVALHVNSYSSFKVQVSHAALGAERLKREDTPVRLGRTLTDLVDAEIQ